MNVFTATEARAAWVVLALLLPGCAAFDGGGPLLKGSGTPTDAPAGYVAQCAQHPGLENCKP